MDAESVDTTQITFSLTKTSPPNVKKEVLASIPKIQHRPTVCDIRAAINPVIVSFQRSFNFKKANWKDFFNVLDKKILKIKSHEEQKKKTTS